MSRISLLISPASSAYIPISCYAGDANREEFSVMKGLLRQLDIGNSVAEYDDHLEKYFLQTQLFNDFIAGKYNIVRGDKGTGKTAIFSVIQKQQAFIPELSDVIQVPVFNQAGTPVFQKFADIKKLAEAKLGEIWKAYIFAVVGNKLVDDETLPSNREKDALRKGLEKLGLREKNATFVTLLGRSLSVLNIQLKVRFWPINLDVKKVGKVKADAETQIGEPGLRLIKDYCQSCRKSVWVMFDRLDEAFVGQPKIELPALRALFRTYLDLQSLSPQVQLKLFVRKDLYQHITEGGFVNLTHVQARSTGIGWSDDDLYALLCQRLRQSEGLMAAIGIDKRSSNETLFGKIFPAQVDAGDRKPTTWNWMLSRIQDGNGLRSPRNLVDLVNKARDQQIRKEERQVKRVERSGPLIEAEALKAALTELSEMRVNDTLLAESGDAAPYIKLFRRNKAEHNRASIGVLLKKQGEALDDIINRLKDVGFVQEVGGSLKIPMLYRSGLGIIQGKGFVAED